MSQIEKNFGETTGQTKQAPAGPGYSDEESVDLDSVDHAYTDEERALLRKLDWKIVLWLFVLYFLSVEDRVNVGFAMTMNTEQGHDLMAVAGLSPRQNNLGLALFYVAYIICELPSNLIMTRINPGLWIARIMTTWGVVTACMATIHSDWSFYLLRVLLGALEAGFWPGMGTCTLAGVPSEISSRIGSYYLAAPLSGAFGGLISAGIQLMDTDGGLLFLFSGLISIIFGVITIWYLPSTPTHTPKHFPFLTQSERALATTRLAHSTAPSKSWTARDLVPPLSDPKTYLFSILYFTPVMAATSLGYFIPKIVQQMGTFTSIQVSLISIPPYAFGGIVVTVATKLSDHCRQRGLFIIACAISAVIGFVVLSFADPLGASMAWTANTSQTPLAIAITTSIVSSLANFGALICTFALYSGWPADAPRYIGSNMINGGAMLLAAATAGYLKWDLGRQNRKMDREGVVGMRFIL
ncbi:major facilitator superfamily domain-containing protein [Jimgerdemannia flammicorona]|uniref:Major facilitator superfamily domain-containing protein n=1 Tax=Jimgerdemannia flammicorona TaxID=994334 RepID=A0A433CWB2_9FUNG|nr:major facilitator superfamily domain-containing protein [Jimgerdemannia flammicorona]